MFPPTLDFGLWTLDLIHGASRAHHKNRDHAKRSPPLQSFAIFPDSLTHHGECANSSTPSAACPPSANRAWRITLVSPPSSSQPLSMERQREILSRPARPDDNRPHRLHSRRKQLLQILRSSRWAPTP